MDVVVQEASPEQAEVGLRALDLYGRILSGQLGEIAALAADGRLRPREGHEITPEGIARLRALMDEARGLLGFSRGEGGGLGPRAHPDVNHAYEAHAVLAKCLADRRAPRPEDRAGRVAHDGLMLRYAPGPAPSARVEGRAG